MLPPISPCQSKEENIFILQWTDYVFMISSLENESAPLE